MRSWLAAGLLVAAFGLVPASAQDANPSSGEIVKGLAKPATRSLTRSLGGGDSAGRRFLDNLPTTRGLKLDEREELVKVVETQKLPSIDIRIEFAHDSAELTDHARLAINQLGQALLSPELKSAKIALNGHTDASGSNDYNQALSERRAIAVQDYLASTFGADRARLVVAGFGEERLKDPHDPEGAVNRRVEVVNLTY